MAKKKTAEVEKPEEIEEDDIGDLDDELLGDDEPLDDDVSDESGANKPKKGGKSPAAESDFGDEEFEIPSTPRQPAPAPKGSPIVLAKDDIADKLTEQLEEEESKKDYKYVGLSISEDAPNEWTMYVKNQGHGFCNYLVSKILKIKGINYAAYKLTSLEPAKFLIRSDGTKDIKGILKEAVKLMQIEIGRASCRERV